MLAGVLDACVLYPASLRDTLLRAALAGLYRPWWSAQILEETTRNLREKRGLSAEQARRLVAAMTDHFEEASVTGHEIHIPVLTCHEKDRHVLAAAVHAHAQVIVTFNLKDFPVQSLEPFAIEAQHPDTFVTHLFDLTPDSMLGLLHEQAEALRKPPTTFERVLETLQQHVPVFVGKVRRYRQDNEGFRDERHTL